MKEKPKIEQVCVFTTPTLGDLISRCIQDNQTHTFAQYFSLFISLPLFILFSLSSWVYHGLYSLESPYTTVKSQELDCFHVLGFIAGFLPH